MKKLLIVLAAMFGMAACGSECNHNHENCANQTPTETATETPVETVSETIAE